MEVNKNQRLAIESGSNPILVVAGAGSGKTFVLTNRIIYLTEKCGYHPNSILAFTFTNKAANEIKKRINEYIPGKIFNWIGTFHSICLKILRYDSDKIGRNKDFLIIDEDEKLSIIKDIYLNNEYNKEIINQKKMISYISLVKNYELDSEEYSDIYDFFIELDYDSTKSKMIAETYIQYQKKLNESNSLDFDDLIRDTLLILEKNKEIREKWQNHFNYILVDEFQDTNYQQFKIIKLLSKNKRDIFVVGDPDQMIYSWRGAYSNIFDDFKNYFVGYDQIILDQNYRSTKGILEVSNKLISNNKNRIEKNLFTNNSIGDKIIYYHASSSDEESKWIIDKIRILKNSGYSYNDMLILYRSNYLSRNIEQAMISYSIPYIIYGGLKFFQRKEIKDILAYLKLAVLDDDLSLSRIYNVPKRKIGESSFSKVTQFATLNNISTFEALKRIDEIDSINESIKSKLIELRELIQRIKDYKYLFFTDLVDYILKETSYFEYLSELDEEYRIDNIKEFKTAIKEYQTKNPKSELINYIQELCLYTDMDVNKNIDESVSLMTVHNSKGLEYKIVFLISFNEGDFPSTKALEENSLEEERRIAYVAMTRAMKMLFISSSDGISFSGKESHDKIPSRFLKEFVKLDCIEMIVPKKQKNNLFWDNEVMEVVINDPYHNEDIDFMEGEKIIHDVFGEGIVLKINNDIMDIAFKAPYGVKKIMKNHKIIKKIKN